MRKNRKLHGWLRENSYKPEERTYTQNKADYLSILNKNKDYVKINSITKDNIAYNLVYLEYLQIQLDELVLIELLEKIIYKNYIITATSIIEAILKEITSSSNKESLKKMIEKLSEYNNLKLTTEEISKLDEVREVRNNVHLSMTEKDWFIFTKEQLEKVKQILHKILTAENAECEELLSPLKLK